MAGGGCQPETRRQTSGCIEKTYYSTPATWKPFEKQKSVHMAYVMRLSAFDGPLRSRRPAALSTMQSPVVFQPFERITDSSLRPDAGASAAGFDAGVSFVVKRSRA
jgi:hypothetical protein